jgi:hypothetical protein
MVYHPNDEAFLVSPQPQIILAVAVHVPDEYLYSRMTNALGARSTVTYLVPSGAHCTGSVPLLP